MDRELCVLLLEDSDEDAFFIERELRKTGTRVQVRRARGETEFNAALAPPPPDIIVSDYTLPGFDGLSALTVAQRVLPDVPYVFVSGTIGEERAIEALKRGASDYILKDRLGRLPAALTRALAEAGARVARRREHEELEVKRALLEAALAEQDAGQRQMLVQVKLHALGEMAVGVAHEFQEALQPILGQADLLLQPPLQLEPDVRKRVELIRTAAEDARAVARRLQELYQPRKREVRREAVDVHQVVQDAVELASPRWKTLSRLPGTPIQVTLDLAPVPRVEGDAMELREALLTLLFNAVDAMPTGGTLTLRARRDEGGVDLEVEDSGTGMTEDTRARCFEPFLGTPRAEGAGLGLAMVQGIVQRHGGTIEVRSEPGRGTSFRIRLPGMAP